MSTDALLDRILVPRPGGSEGLLRVADFVAQGLRESGAQVSLQAFEATPHGFALVWSAVLLLVAGYVAAIATRRYGLALALLLSTAALLLLEFEGLRSPVSGLLSQREHNVIGTFPGAPGGPLLVFSAHYDTATHFGDHLHWGRFGFAQGPATALGIALALLGMWRARRGAALPRTVARVLAPLVALPFAAMFVFQTAGPLLRQPGVGALDNGGSVAALLRLAQELADRPASAPTTVQLVFTAAEEERTLGSWAFAQTLDPQRATAVVNLESVGASGELALITEDGFALTRYHSPAWLVEWVDAAARDLWGRGLPARELPPGTLTDGRSFLAHRIPALTLRAFVGDAFPRRLHSLHDSRDRLSLDGIERSVRLLRSLVEAVDRDPSLLQSTGGAPRA